MDAHTFDAAASGQERTALCIGHPGHEMRVLEWMYRVKPLVDVFTDGSGPGRPSRFYLTADVIHNAGARLGCYQGSFSDRQFYEFILQRSPAPFIEIAERLAASWSDAGIETVAGDMLEGFSPTHDLCRAIINAAVQKVRKSTGRAMKNLQFPLEQMLKPGSVKDAIHIEMSDEQFARKRQVALTAYPALASEVERLISQYGEAAFRVEMLIPAQGSEGLTWDEPAPPFYETYGRKQIEQGHYRDLITHAEHIRPLAEALYSWAGE